MFLSNDDGATWTNVQTAGPGESAVGGWHEYTILTRDLLPTSNRMRLWLEVRNTNSSTMVEAAVDAVTVARFTCSSSSCCQGVTGNVNRIAIVDLSDLSALVSYLTSGGFVLLCVPEANINNVGIVDLSDLSALVSYLTGGGYTLPNCL